MNGAEQVGAGRELDRAVCEALEPSISLPDAEAHEGEDSPGGLWHSAAYWEDGDVVQWYPNKVSRFIEPAWVVVRWFRDRTDEVEIIGAAGEWTVRITATDYDGGEHLLAEASEPTAPLAIARAALAAVEADAAAPEGEARTG